MFHTDHGKINYWCGNQKVIKRWKGSINLTAEMLHSNNGLNILLEKLDAIFQSEEIKDAYHIYSKCSGWNRQANISMNDFIIEFEN